MAEKRREKKNIPYRKSLPPKATKQLGSGGPRDMQRRQGVGSAEINMPKIDMEALKEVLLNNKEMREEFKAEIRKEMGEVKEVVESNKNIEGIGLPFEVVEQKIKEAVEQTEKGVRERYESGLGSLNSQLNASKAQVKELNARLAERKQEITELKKQVWDRDAKLEEKDDLINTLREQQNQEVGDLKTKIMDLIDKIKSGKITSDNYDEARPILEDKIFIDPLSEVETDLDPHINVSAAEAKGYKRDLKSDVEKLKGLLDNKKYKPSKARLKE
jgi:chromosome segregation ATPase